MHVSFTGGYWGHITPAPSPVINVQHVAPSLTYILYLIGFPCKGTPIDATLLPSDKAQREYARHATYAMLAFFVKGMKSEVFQCRMSGNQIWYLN